VSAADVLRGLATHRVLVGVLLLPTFLGALVVWSLGDRAEETERIPAAVVNLDKPVLEKGEQPVAAGRALAAGLTKPTGKQDPTLGWTLTDAEDASKGLADGDYYAVITIPEGFSRQIYRSLHGTAPAKARIQVRSNTASSALIGRISDQVARVSADELGPRVTTSYLGQVFKQTGEIGPKLGQAADGADKLADGSRKLSSGTQSLADGLGTLASGADRLSSGNDELASGASRLAKGTGTAASGGDRLADGLARLDAGTNSLPRDTDRLADGAKQLSDGVVPYTRIVSGWARACADPIILARAPQLCVATERAAGPGDRNAEQLASGSRRLASGTRRLDDAMPALESGIDAAASGARQLASGLVRLEGGTTKLAGGADELASGASRLASGARKASSGASQLASGGEKLGHGSTQLASGLQKGASQVPAYDAQEGRDLARVIAAPVAARAATVGETPDGATQLAPGAIAFVLWLGAFVTYLVRPALPTGLLGRATSASRVSLGGLRPGVLVGAVQAVLLYVALLALGADFGSPGLTLVLMLVAAAGFAAVNQGLVAVFGRRRGWIASIAFAGLQLAALGGVIPVDTAPEPLQLLNDVLPMTQAADALAVSVLDGPGSVLGSAAVVVLWALVAFGATVLAARKAQQVDVHELVVEERERELELA
jgi:putative membrane protein